MAKSKGGVNVDLEGDDDDDDFQMLPPHLSQVGARPFENAFASCLLINSSQFGLGSG